MVNKTLKNISKTNNKHIITPQDLRDIEHDIQGGNQILLEEFGSQEKVDEYLRIAKEKSYQKLFSTPVTCSKPNCSYLS